MFTDSPCPPLPALEGLWNLRDLGQLPAAEGRIIRRGLVYRGDDLGRLTDRDLEQLAKLRFRTIVDFRSQAETAEFPDRVPQGAKAVHLPIAPGNVLSLDQVNHQTGPGMMRELYTLLAHEAKPQWQAFFQLLASPENLPLLFHCTAGKDRTGTAAALLLAALGVKTEVILNDYLISRQCAETKYKKLLAKRPELLSIITVEPEYLNAFFEAINLHYGNLETYLTQELHANLPLLRTHFTFSGQ